MVPQRPSPSISDRPGLASRRRSRAQFVERRLQIGLILDADNAVGGLAVVIKLDGRDASDPLFAGQLLKFVDVDFQDGGIGFGGQLLDCRR